MVVEPLGNAKADPNAAPPRQRLCWDKWGLLSHDGAAARGLTLCRWKARVATPKRNAPPTRLATHDPTDDCLRTLQPLLQPRSIAKALCAGAGGDTRVPPSFQPPFAAVSPPTPWLLLHLRSALRTALPTPRCLRPSWGGASDSAALITLFTTLRSLSFDAPPTILELFSSDCLSKQRKRVANKLANTDAATGRFGSPLRRAAVDKFIHNPPYLLFCSAKVTWRFTSRQASDALTITEAAFFQMSAVIHDS